MDEQLQSSLRSSYPYIEIAFFISVCDCLIPYRQWGV